MVEFSYKLFIHAFLLVIMILVIQDVEFVRCNKYFGRHSILQFREKPRSTRGFKSVALSTARGFGKRDGTFKFFDVEPFTHRITQRESFPVDWLIEEMANDPELTRIFIKKFIDTNQDDEITADELIRLDNSRITMNNIEEQ